MYGAVRATSEDGMTSEWARLPHDLLGKISKRIVSEVHNVIVLYKYYD